MFRQWMTAAVAAGMTLIGSQAMAYEKAFEMTPVDEIQVRTLPPGTWLVAEGEGDYFDKSNGLFMKLFNYIKENEVSMTVPVEGDLDGASMRFYVGDADGSKRLDDTEAVDVVRTGDRLVASIGARGSYSESNVRTAQAELQQWLAKQNEYVADGPAYAVFWDGPFTLWFMKRFEVHVPVKK